MVVLYHHPSLTTLSAQRTIYTGFKNAFTDLGHTFLLFTNEDDLAALLKDNKVDLFITSTHFYYRKAVDIALLQKYRAKGLRVMVKIDYWNAPPTLNHTIDAPSLKDDLPLVALIKSGNYADLYYSTVEPDDPRMRGWKETTGQSYTCIPLAADAITLANPQPRPEFTSDVAFLGTNSPAKRATFAQYLYPLRQHYDLQLYGQDWTVSSRVLGVLQKVGQFINWSVLASIRKPPLQLSDERDLYASAKINLNLHEDHQRISGGDCNERTFKIPFCGGFELTDNVACLHTYFKVGIEIIVARDAKEWRSLIDYYLKHPVERQRVIAAGKARVTKDHTYHNRVHQVEALVGTL